MGAVSGLLFELFIIYLAAKIAEELFARLGQPAVIGELLAGVVIGPYALGLIGHPSDQLVALFHGDPAAAQEAMQLVYHLLAELGAVVLLFFVGLETQVAGIIRVGGRAATVALLGVIIPFLLGFSLMGPLLGHSSIESLFTGAAMMATSVGITARVLRDLGQLESSESRVILGAAVVDDILAMVALAIVAGLASTGSVNLVETAIIAAEALFFTLFVALAGTGAMRRFGLHLARLRMAGAPFAISLLVMLGLATLATQIGLTAIIGAFLAGMVFAETREHFELERQALPIYQFLVPFFFVITGSQVNWRLFTDGGLMALALGITALAILGKGFGCGLPMIPFGLRSAAIVGVGMVPRGEVGLIVASLGLTLGAVAVDIFSVVVIMSILTTLVAPPALAALYAGRGRCRREGGEESEQCGQLPDL